MKKTHLITCILLLTAKYVSAQGGGLQFNQVLLVSSSLQTVPSGKIWKVEKMMTQAYYIYQHNTGSCNQSNSDPYMVHINNNVYFLNSSISTGQSGYMYAPGCTEGPLWLPEGTTLKTQCPGSLLSIIEFNVIP
jgi:hypothetical protein